MSQAGTLLVEARVEEMPPQLLRGLANQFPDNLAANLRKAGFADDESFREKNADGHPKTLATPRRLVALLKNIRRVAPDRMLIRRGPQVAAALDKDGRPTKALEGFLRATGKTVGDLRKTTERGKEYFAADLRESGGTLDDKLAAIVQETLLSLNAPRLMRWGSHDWRFVRPLRGMLMLWESDAIGGEVMGVKAGRVTLGHRFMSEGAVDIPSAAAYEGAMTAANVIVDFDARVSKINSDCESVARENNGAPLWPTLLDIVHFPENNMSEILAAMTESPRAHCGKISSAFMDIPAACFNLCLWKHQRCFPMASAERKRIPKFLFVADNDPEDPSEMIHGFERVLSARLADVDFYLKEDRKASLEESREKLKSIVYHEKLGSQFDRAERIRAIAAKIGVMMKLDESETEALDRAAFICKADLPTLMIGEHPELEGVMAAEYFSNDDADVRTIVEEHNRPSIDLPLVRVACLLLANHMEKIAGMFWAGEKPTGDKDPHGLRGMASYVARVLSSENLDGDNNTNGLDKIYDGQRRSSMPPPQAMELIDAALSVFSDDGSAKRADEIYDYLAERLRQNLNSTPELDAILSQRPRSFSGVAPKMNALAEFKKTPESAILISANKRVNNIFRKSGVSPESLPTPDDSLFEHDEERKLFRAMEEAREKSGRHIVGADNSADAQGCYRDALESLLDVAAPVDAFFDRVMVNAEDEKIRANRFALLAELRALLNQVADISKLSG